MIAATGSQELPKRWHALCTTRGQKLLRFGAWNLEASLILQSGLWNFFMIIFFARIVAFPSGYNA